MRMSTADPEATSGRNRIINDIIGN